MYKLLCADDETLIREALTLFVKRLGVAIRCVADGATCVKTFRDAPNDYDLVIVNYDMPGMNGIQVIRELRRIAPGKRVALSTAYPESDILGDLPPGEVVGFLRKPYTIADLRRFLRESLPRVEPCLLALEGEGSLLETLHGGSGEEYRVRAAFTPTQLLRRARSEIAPVVCLDASQLDLQEVAALDAERIPILVFSEEGSGDAAAMTGREVLPRAASSEQLARAVAAVLRA